MLHGFNIGDILLLKPLILQVYHSGDEDQQITPILFVPTLTREKPGELPQILELLTLLILALKKGFLLCRVDDQVEGIVAFQQGPIVSSSFML